MILLSRTSTFANRTFLELIKTVYGINYSRAMLISAACGLSPYVRIKNLPDRIFHRVEEYVVDKFLVGREARQILQKNIKQLQKIGGYRALRMEQGLPAHGQRTHSNAKTAKKFGRVKNLYFRTDVHRFRSDDPRRNYVRRGKRSNKPIVFRPNATRYTSSTGTMNTYKNSNSFGKKLPFLIRTSPHTLNDNKKLIKNK